MLRCGDTSTALPYTRPHKYGGRCVSRFQFHSPLEVEQNDVPASEIPTGHIYLCTLPAFSILVTTFRTTMQYFERFDVRWEAMMQDFLQMAVSIINLKIIL
jgi:hypothetical protein